MLLGRRKPGLKPYILRWFLRIILGSPRKRKIKCGRKCKNWSCGSQSFSCWQIGLVAQIACHTPPLQGQKCLCSPHYDPDCQVLLVLSPQISSCSMPNVTDVRKNTIPKVKGSDQVDTCPQVFLFRNKSFGLTLWLNDWRWQYCALFQ